MKLHDHYHLTYCTNIHPAESWEDTEASLKEYIPAIKRDLSPEQPLGIGLRLSNMASETLLQESQLAAFKRWLADHDAYVFTMNGFPYGNFHRQVVKGEVHQPDWTTQERLQYTLRLFDILAELLPADMDGGISTSPLSYKLWHKTAEERKQVMHTATMHIAEVAAYLYKLFETTGKYMHLDIEPEPDGMMENTQEVLDFYALWLMPLGTEYLKKHLGLSTEAAEACLKDHIRICYDVCHFAVVYEKPEEVFNRLQFEGIKIGKVQISAALKSALPASAEQRAAVVKAFEPFVESTYLHQVVQKNQDGSYTHFNDLPAAMAQADSPKGSEWRTHFHVPVFLENYGTLQATQSDILDTFAYLKNTRSTNHLEVETYTWEVLPEDIRLPLGESISRELAWVKQHIK